MGAHGGDLRQGFHVRGVPHRLAVREEHPVQHELRLVGVTGNDHGVPSAVSGVCQREDPFGALVQVDLDPAVVLHGRRGSPPVKDSSGVDSRGVTPQVNQRTVNSMGKDIQGAVQLPSVM